MDRHYTVEELIALCHANRISKIKVGPIELEFSPAALLPDPVVEAPKGQMPAMPKPIDFLTWSIPDTTFDAEEINGKV